MALIFLIAALICLALGLLLASALWLALSLAASLAAAALLLWSRTSRWRTARSTAPRDEPATTPPVEPDKTIAAPASADAEVWVVDGRPRYHRRDCAQLAGQDAEAIPRAQADEDGFLACSLCEPNVDRSGHSS